MMIPKNALLLLLSWSALAVTPADTFASSCAAETPAVSLVERFQDLIDRKEFEQAALLIADDAEISTPFGKKTKDQFLHKLQTSKNSPVWGESEIGIHERQCVTQGTRTIGFLKIKLKRTVEINEDNKIHNMIVSKQW